MTIDEIRKVRYTQEGIEKGKIQDAKNFLKLGIAEEIVSAGTGLSIEKIRDLKRELLN